MQIASSELHHYKNETSSYENKISVIGVIMSNNNNLHTDMPDVQELEVLTDLMHLLSLKCDGWLLTVWSGMMISLGFIAGLQD